ncbi:hypothetical protein SUDANB1_00481 [Streptomyces sp. enrichment culture]|uniref:hypothetical protein n=1 Tax=Streptomyces sp. enrichment culture TaxID=1795815 RepID=UPI003F56DC46
MGNDIEIRVRVANQTGTGLTSVNTSLNTLRDRARAASTALTALRTAARDINVAVNLDDRTVAGFADIERSMLGIRAAASTDLRVGLDDQTTAGFTTIFGRIRDLRAESPIRLDVTFDDQSGQINDSARAMRDLTDAARNAHGELATLAARALAATVSLHRLAAAAEDATRELRGLHTAAGRAATSVGRLGQRADDTDGRLFDLTGTTAHLTLQMGDLGSASRDTGDDLRNLRGNLGNLTVSAGNAANAFGGGGGGGAGLRGQLIGVAAALGAGLLPSIGALSPMLFGIAGVGGAAALAAKDLKEQFKKLKPEFQDLQKVASKAVLPGVKRSMDDLRGAMKGLEPVVKVGGQAFGKFTESAAKFADSPAFKSALLTNVKMGSEWFGNFTDSIFDFTQAFLDFGSKSQPALDAWDSLLGGLLDTGLPGMFDGLEQGISGSSEMLGGFASLLNDSLLPALGKISGAFAETFGPLMGEMFRGLGLSIEGFAGLFEGAMEGIEPIVHVITDGFRALNEIGRIAFSVVGDLASVLGGALVESLLAVAGVDVSSLGEGFRGLSNWAKENETAIRGAFVQVGHVIIDMVNTGIQWLPLLSAGFTLMAKTAIDSADLVVSGLAMAFGNVPGIGEALKASNERFDEWATGAKETLDGVNGKIGEFAATANEKLGRAKLKLDVKQAEANLSSIKEKLNDKSLTAERKAKLSADKSQAEAVLRDARGKLDAYDRKKAEASITADARAFFGTASRVNGTKFSTKRVPVGANRSFFDAAVRAISGSVVGTAYINVYQRKVEASNQTRFRAMGGPVRGYADGGSVQHFPNGGYVEGPGGPRSDSILATFASGATAAVSDTEYVVQSSAVKKYGLPLLDALNRGTLKLARGGVTKAEAAARKDARGDLTISHFGHMGGYQRSEFRSALAKPDSLSSLINSLNSWRSQIMKATHGGTERTLLRALDSTGRKLLAYEKQLTSVTKSLESAKDKLNSLKQAASQLTDSVKSGVLNASNITRRQGDGPVTVASIMGGLTASRDKATSFDKALADLKKKGLSSSLLQQIAEAGVDGGGLETAGALLNASSSEIKSMNSLQGQINSAATSAGKTTADAVFGGAIKTQTAVVKLLTGQQQRLTKSMDKLASAMEKLVEKGFGMKAAGGIIGAASGGARGSWTMVGEHEPELVRLPFGSRVYSGPDTRRMQQGAWASMLNTPRSGGARYAPTPAAGAQPIVVHQTITLDSRVVAQQIFDPLRKEIANRGGSVQKSLGQGAG